MPYKTPLRKKGIRETVFEHTVKLCWFYVKFEDIHDKITLKKFCENFEEIVVTEGIWEKVISEFNIDCDLHKADGSIHKPNYKKLFAKKGWINQYGWREQYPIFEANKLMSTPDTEREKYYRNMSRLNQQDYELMETCHEKEKEYCEKEKETGKDMTYYRNKNNETKSQTDERLRKRIGINEENINIKSENTNNNLNINLTDEQVLDENADTFERFISRRMRKTDEADK